MDISHLFVTLSVESSKFLSRRGTDCLFEIGMYTGPATARFFRDPVTGIDALGAIGGFVFRVEILESASKAIGNTVLVVESYGTLDGGIADSIAVGKVFSKNSRPWLILLRNVIVIALRFFAWLLLAC